MPAGTFVPSLSQIYVCMCSERGVGGAGRNFLYMVCACRMAPFFSAAKYMISPFFQAKGYDRTHFSELVYERPHFSEVSRYMHIYFVQRFFEASCSLGIQ